MKPIIMEMKDMRESVEVYESRPNPVFVYFIYLLLILLLVALGWMYFSTMDVVVKSSGRFRNRKQPVEISSSVSGKVIKSNLKEGQYVAEGEVLVTIEAESLEVTIGIQEEALQDTKERLEILKAYDWYLKGKGDVLSSYEENAYYQEFLGKKQLLELGSHATQEERERQKKQTKKELENIRQLMAQYETQISKLKTTQEGIKNRSNPFSSEDSYYQSIINSYISGYNLMASQYDAKIQQQITLIQEAEKQIAQLEQNQKELVEQGSRIEQEESLRKELEASEKKENEVQPPKESMVESVSGQPQVEKKEEGVAEEGTELMPDTAAELGKEGMATENDQVEEDRIKQPEEVPPETNTASPVEEGGVVERLARIEAQKEENRIAIESLNQQMGEYYQTSNQLKQEKENSLRNLELQQITSLEQQIDTLSRTLQSTKTNEVSLQAQLETLQENSLEEKTEIDFLTEQQKVAEEILSYETKQKEEENALKQYDLENGHATIRATQAGYLSLQQELKVGSYLTQGSTIGQILPEDSKDFYAEIYVENADVARLKEGQKVMFEIEAYPSREYGTITGTLESVSKDSKLDQASGSAYYLAKVSCNDTTLMNEKGESGEIISGMTCQAKIIVGEKSVLQFLLEKLEFMKQ